VCPRQVAPCVMLGGAAAGCALITGPSPPRGLPSSQAPRRLPSSQALLLPAGCAHHRSFSSSQPESQAALVTSPSPPRRLRSSQILLLLWLLPLLRLIRRCSRAPLPSTAAGDLCRFSIRSQRRPVVAFRFGRAGLLRCPAAACSRGRHSGCSRSRLSWFRSATRRNVRKQAIGLLQSEHALVLRVPAPCAPHLLRTNTNCCPRFAPGCIL
jgi:hypothetical protein